MKGKTALQLSPEAAAARRAYYEEYREKNRDRINAYHNKWAHEHPDRVRVYRENGKEKYKATRRAWELRNAEKRLEYHREWRRRNREKILEERRKDPERFAEYQRTYWERKAKNRTDPPELEPAPFEPAYLEPAPELEPDELGWGFLDEEDEEEDGPEWLWAFGEDLEA